MKQLLVSLCMLVSMSSFAQQGEKNFIDQNYIEVSGKAEMELLPDMIYLKVVLHEKDLKSSMSLAEAEQRMIQRLKEAGVDVTKDVTIKDFTGNLQSKIFSKEVSLSKEYSILVHDGKTAAAVFSRLGDMNISNISIDKLDNSKMEEYLRQIKIKTIKVAQAKAQALAEAIGQKTGRALFITEVQHNFYAAQANLANTFSQEKQEGNASVFNFENLKIDATLLCRFELK